MKDTNIITSVTESEDWYSLTFGLSCGLKKKYGVIPKVGDSITVHTKGGAFGTIRGIDINGVPVFWKTDEELEAARLKWLKEQEERKQKQFQDNVAKMDAQYAALPQCFKERISKFRYNNDRFRIDYESYELFCCEQAIEIAKACVTPAEVEKFKAKPWEQQIKQVPNLSEDHSGNTFGAACALAYWYLEQPFKAGGF